MEPLVTIIITSYNYAQHIADAINSALSQSYSNIEVLVLDNASTDNSLEVIATFEDKRLRVIARPQNVGIQRNHNLGIQEARGDFIVFLSADDMLLPTLVEDGMRYRAAHPDIDIVYASAIIVNDAGEGVFYFEHPSFDGAEYYSKRDEFTSLLTRDNCAYLPTILFPRTVFEELGPLDEELEIVLDYEFVVRMASAGKRFAYSSKPGALIRFHGENRSGVKNFVGTGKQLREFCTILTRYTGAQYRQRLAGWRAELDRMVVTKINEMNSQFPAEFREHLPDLEPRINAARASIQQIPGISEAALRGEGMISVILPTTGRVHLMRALESLRHQEYERWEAIVVVDGAAYDPSGLIAAMGLSDKVRVSKTRGFRGAAAARNLGIGGANGEIICYLDDDNRFGPGYLRAVATALADPAVHAVTARTRLVAMSSAGELLLETNVPPSTDGQVSWITNRLPLNSVAHRRACFAESGIFETRRPVLEDWEFLLRLNKAFRFRPLDASVDVCIDIALLGHQVFGRHDTPTWNDFITQLNSVYAAFPPRSPLDAELRNAYLGTLPAVIQAGVNARGKAQESMSFLRGVMGVA